jgi:hypothetical protein
LGGERIHYVRLVGLFLFWVLDVLGLFYVCFVASDLDVDFLVLVYWLRCW